MCIIAVATNFDKDFDFLLIHNRDEFFSRTATPPEIRGGVDDGNMTLVCPIDEQSGGTWMGVNASTGTVVALTNVRAVTTYSNRKSRGELVMQRLIGLQEQQENDNNNNCYFNYHLFETKLNENEWNLTTCAPPTYKPQTVVFHPKGQPCVVTKSNDHGVGFTTNDKESDNIRWPKAIWFRREIERILQKHSPVEEENELKKAKLLLAKLETPMSASEMTLPYSQQADATVPSPWNPLSLTQERKLAKAPFVLPFYLYDDDDESLYGTVSQSALFYSSKSKVLYYAHRTTIIDDNVHQLPEWTWQTVNIA